MGEARHLLKHRLTYAEAGEEHYQEAERRLATGSGSIAPAAAGLAVVVSAGLEGVPTLGHVEMEKNLFAVVWCVSHGALAVALYTVVAYFLGWPSWGDLELAAIVLAIAAVFGTALRWIGFALVRRQVRVEREHARWLERREGHMRHMERFRAEVRRRNALQQQQPE